VEGSDDTLLSIMRAIYLSTPVYKSISGGEDSINTSQNFTAYGFFEFRAETKICENAYFLT
jgi:hypothetical protein